MNPCPHCHVDAGFFVNGQVSGNAQIYYGKDGTYQTMGSDKLHWKTQSSAVRCDHCGKIRRDVRFENRDSVVEVTE